MVRTTYGPERVEKLDVIMSIIETEGPQGMQFNHFNILAILLAINLLCPYTIELADTFQVLGNRKGCLVWLFFLGIQDAFWQLSVERNIFQKGFQFLWGWKTEWISNWNIFLPTENLYGIFPVNLSHFLCFFVAVVVVVVVVVRYCQALLWLIMHAWILHN